jgi:hypothetical protein
MRRASAFRPSLLPLEDRLAPSLSFSGMLHSVLPFIHDGSSAKKPPGHVALHAAHARPAHHGARPHTHLHAKLPAHSGPVGIA